MFAEAGKPCWSVDGRDWPNRLHSRFVRAGQIVWHVQEMGEGPRLLLLHGTGAATHSFRDFAPALGRHFTVLCPDLPGHGFTGTPPGRGLSLPDMAQLLADLLEKIGFAPDIVVGHSAGAAILAAMALQRHIRPDAIIAINGALRPIRGAALFSPLAKLLSLNPLVPLVVARRARSWEATRRLIESTGSHIDLRGVELYARLFQKPAHVAGALDMMARWDLGWLERRLGALDLPLVLMAAAGDRAVSPADAAIVARAVPSALIVALDEGGHLVHEERPAAIAALVVRLAAEAREKAAAASVPDLSRRGAAS